MCTHRAKNIKARGHEEAKNIKARGQEEAKNIKARGQEEARLGEYSWALTRISMVYKKVIVE
jgi:regulator of protease activity HflC (stomatin/prohibitin superfamily)